MKLTTLIGYRIRLDLMELEDLDEVYKIQSQHGKVDQGAIVRTYERMKSDIIKWADNPYGMYTIRDYETKKIIGTAGFEEVDARYHLDEKYKGKVETCFLRIADEYQGQGIATEARECLFDYILSDHTGVEEVYSFTLNPAVKHLNQKMGFTLAEENVNCTFVEGESAVSNTISVYQLKKADWWKVRQTFPLRTYVAQSLEERPPLLEPIESRSVRCVTL